MTGNVIKAMARVTTSVVLAELAIAVDTTGLTVIGQNTMTRIGAIETNIGRTMVCTVTDPRR